MSQETEVPKPCGAENCPALLYALVPPPPHLPSPKAWSDAETWVTRYGVRVPISEMEPKHMKNLLAWFQYKFGYVNDDGQERILRYQAALMQVRSTGEDQMRLITDAPITEVWTVIFPALPAIVAAAEAREFVIPELLRGFMKSAGKPSNDQGL